MCSKISGIRDLPRRWQRVTISNTAMPIPELELARVKRTRTFGMF